MHSAPPAQQIRFDRYTMQLASRQLLVDGEPAKLGARAFDLLVALIERRDRTVTKNELLDIVWPGLVVEENNLQVHISTLRKLLGPQAIATIPGRGYRFAVPPDRAVDDGADPGAAAAAPSRREMTGNVPGARPELLGRDDELRTLQALVISNRVVTVVELLSPSNKSSGSDRRGYLAKREEYILSGTNLVEIDLLRDGARLPMGRSRLPLADYYVLVSRTQNFPLVDLWAFTVRDELPNIPIPLKPEHDNVPVSLRDCLDGAYEDADYETRIDYALPPDSPLRSPDAVWAARLLKTTTR